MNLIQEPEQAISLLENQNAVSSALEANPDLASLETRPDPPMEKLRQTVSQRSEESGALLLSWIDDEATQEPSA